MKKGRSMVKGCRNIAYVCSALAAAGCSGGAQSTPTTAFTARPSVTAAKPAAAARLTVRLPAHGAVSSFRRSREFVSPATSGVDIEVYTDPQAQNPTPVLHLTADLSSGSSACAADPGGTRTCTIALPITAGTFDFVLTLYDAAPVSGSFTSAHELGAGSVTKTIVRNADNVVSVAIDGTIASLALAPGRQTYHIETPATFAIGVTPLDADLDTILAGSADTYQNPVTVSVSDTGSHMKLSLNGGTPAVSVTSTQLLDRITAIYDGAGTRGYAATVTASASGATSASAFLDSFYVSPTTTNFTSYGTTATITADEPHAAGAFTLQSVVCGGVATASPGSGTGEVQTFTITSASSNGTCNYLVSSEDQSLTDRDFIDLYVPGPVPTNRLFVAPGGSAGFFNEYDLTHNGAIAANIDSDFYSNNTTLKGASGITRDASGYIYVADLITQAIDVFTPTVNDNMAPVRMLQGAATQLHQPRLVRIDSAGEIVVLNTNATITVYPPNSNGNVAPTRTITLGNLPADTFYGLALDGSDNIYTLGTIAATPAGTAYLFELPAASSGPAVALRTITGSNTHINAPHGVTVDSGGNVYVTSDVYDNFSEFGPLQNGNASPMFSSSAELNQPAGIVVEPDGTVVTNGLTPHGQDIVTYPPGAVHAATEFMLSGEDSPNTDLSL